MADDDRAALLAEANRRGLLPPDMKAAYDEAQRRGIVKEPTGKLERLETGFMDPVYGAAQLGARMQEPTAFDTDEIVRQRQQTQETVDKAVREREQQYRAPQGVDWMRLAGSALNPIQYVPLAAGGVPGAVLSGALSGAIEPATGPNVGEEKLTSTGVGGVVGGVLGTAAKAGAAGIRSLGNYLAREYPENVMTQAVQAVLRRMHQDAAAGAAPSATDMIDLINAASAKGKPMTAADLGSKNVERLAGQTYRAGGTGSAAIDKFLDERDAGAAQRLSSDIAKYVKSGGSMYNTTEALIKARSASGKPLWEQVRAMPGVWSERLKQFLDAPVIREGLSRGQELDKLEALAEGRPVEANIGITRDAEGNMVMTRAPSMRELHMAKMGLDAMIADERNEITGRLSARGVALDKVREAYIAEIDSLDKHGIYKAARAAWQGPSKSLDAVRAGRGVFANSPDEIAAEFAKMSKSDQEFYRVGVADILREKLAKTGVSGDEAKSLIKNPWTRDQLRPIFRTDKEFDEFTNAVTAESRMFRTNVAVRRGGTAEQLAEDTGADAERLMFTAKMAKNIATGSWPTAIKDAWFKWRDLGLKPNPAVTEQIAKLLFATPTNQEGAVALDRLAGRIATPAPRNPLGGAGDVLHEAGGALTPGATSALSQGHESPFAP